MNVSEIDSAKTSISGFVVLAILLLLISYTVRLVIRSSSTTAATQSLMADVRQSARTPPGRPVRTRDFLAWGIPGYRALYRRLVAKELAKGWVATFQGFLIAAVPFVVSAAAVWSRSSLIGAVKAAISTALMVPFVCGLIGYGIYAIQNRITLFVEQKKVEQRNQSLLLRRYDGAVPQDNGDSGSETS
jgi:hypothetical protein